MKFEEVENSYERTLLLNSFGNGKALQVKLNNMTFEKNNKRLARGCGFEEQVYNSNLGTAFALKVIQIPQTVYDPQEKLLLEAVKNQIVLSIHLIIEENEKKGFMGFGKKVEKHIIVHTKVNRAFYDKNDRNLQYSIISFKDKIESESGLKIKEFKFEDVD
jgi:hypothetical protein